MEPCLDKCTLTFENEQDISSGEIEQIFANFSKFVQIREYKGRVFVRLGKEVEAANAIDCLNGIFKMTYARQRAENDKSKKSNNHNGSSSLESTQSRENYGNNSRLDSGSNAKYMFNTNKVETAKQEQSAESLQKPSIPDSRNFSNFGSSSGASVASKNSSDLISSTVVESVKSFNNDDSGLSWGSTPSTTLIDMKNIQKMFSIILANLPEAFTLEDILNLVEECEPMALTEFHHTKGKKLKFCEIYLKSSEDIAYLKKKLDRFVISGKKLMAVEASECLVGAKWIL